MKFLKQIRLFKLQIFAHKTGMDLKLNALIKATSCKSETIEFNLTVNSVTVAYTFRSGSFKRIMNGLCFFWKNPLFNYK